MTASTCHSRLKMHRVCVTAHGNANASIEPTVDVHATHTSTDTPMRTTFTKDDTTSGKVTARTPKVVRISKSKPRPPWMPLPTECDTVPDGLVLIHSCSEPKLHKECSAAACHVDSSTGSDTIDWLVTDEVRKTLMSSCRYGDTSTGVSFATLFQQIKRYWTPSLIRKILVPVIESTFEASGRVIEWAHTNYSCCHGMVDSIGMSVSQCYADELKRTQRRKFDTYVRVGSPFVYLRVDGKLLRSSVAQLHFFKWTTSRGILDTIMDKLDDIRKHMRETLSERKKQGHRSKRRKLCAAQKSGETIVSTAVERQFSL